MAVVRADLNLSIYLRFNQSNTSSLYCMSSCIPWSQTHNHLCLAVDPYYYS